MSNRVSEIQLSITDSNSLSAYKLELGERSCWFYCISQDELCLLARDELSPIELTAQLESDAVVKVECFDVETNSLKTEEDGVDIDALLAFFMEKEDEKYECWDHDGGEGISEAASSENGRCYVLAYKLLENIHYPYQYFKDCTYDECITTEEVCKKFVQEIHTIDDFNMDEWIEERW